MILLQITITSSLAIITISVLHTLLHRSINVYNFQLSLWKWQIKIGQLFYVEIWISIFSRQHRISDTREVTQGVTADFSIPNE